MTPVFRILLDKFSIAEIKRKHRQSVNSMFIPQKARRP